jgi:hypothetical protein
MDTFTSSLRRLRRSFFHQRIAYVGGFVAHDDGDDQDQDQWEWGYKTSGSAIGEETILVSFHSNRRTYYLRLRRRTFSIFNERDNVK